MADELTSRMGIESLFNEELSKAAEIVESIAQEHLSEYAVSSRLEDMMTGADPYGDTYKLNETYSGQFASEQCKGFAKDVFIKLFGYAIGSTDDHYKINYDSNKTAYLGSVTGISKDSDADEERLKELFSQARAGDFIQMQRHHGGSHSAIFVSKSSTGVVFLEANVKKPNIIEENSYTWAQLCNSNANMSIYSDINYKLK